MDHSKTFIIEDVHYVKKHLEIDECLLWMDWDYNKKLRIAH